MTRPPSSISQHSTDGCQTGASATGRNVTPKSRLETSSTPFFTRSYAKYGRTACESNE